MAKDKLEHLNFLYRYLTAKKSKIAVYLTLLINKISENRHYLILAIDKLKLRFLNLLSLLTVSVYIFNYLLNSNKYIHKIKKKQW